MLKDESIKGGVDYTLKSVSREARGAITRPWVCSFTNASDGVKPHLDAEVLEFQRDETERGAFQERTRPGCHHWLPTS